MGMKINGKEIKCTVILNIPRLVFSSNFNCIINSIVRCGFNILTAQGVFWEQALSNGIEAAKDNSEYLLFVDYDSMFTLENIVNLFTLMVENPEYDIVCPIQISRHHNQPLCYHPSIDYDSKFTDIPIGHFGLTIIKSSVFDKIAQPWFMGIPNKDGKWREGKTDPDIYFWNKAKENNIKVMQANHICIGHSDELIKWPNGKTSVTIQTVREFGSKGPPANTHYGSEVPVVQPLVIPQ